MPINSRHPLAPLFLTACGLAPLLLSACGDMFVTQAPPRNFDELIPRLMGAINNRTPEDAALNLFNVTSPDERRDAIAYLQTKPYGHNPPYIKAYEILTTDPHPMVKAQAMRALGTSHQPEAVDYLVKGLSDDDPQVRRDAATGLIITYGESAMLPLTQHVVPPKATDSDASKKGELDSAVRVNAARALRNFQTPEVIRALISALEDRDVAVAFYAHESLMTATTQDHGTDPRAWLTWYQQTYNAPATRPSP